MENNRERLEMGRGKKGRFLSEAISAGHSDATHAIESRKGLTRITQEMTEWPSS